jgi:hypothetical protein
VRPVMVSLLDGEPLRPITSVRIELTLSAMDCLSSTDVDLVIVGTGNAEARLRGIGEGGRQRPTRSRRLRLRWTDFEPRPAYAAADVILSRRGSAARGLAFGEYSP